MDVAFWGGAVPLRGGVPDPAGRVDPDRMAALVDAGVCGFKCFLTDSGVPEFPPVSADDLELAARTCAELDVPLVVHAEDDGVLGEAPPAGADYRSFLASRPPGAETTAVLRLAAVASRTGARIHVLHVSAFEAAEEIGAARAAGVTITGETCPHYLALVSETLTSTAGKCCPPVRSESNRELLWGALAAGRLQAVVSDHSPCPPELKDGGFDRAWGGVSSLELALRVVWSGAHARGHSLDDLAGWMSAAPAALAGLDRGPGRGEGRDRRGPRRRPRGVRPRRGREVDPAALHHRHPVTPYAGLALRGAVRRVWLRGPSLAARGDGRLLAPGAEGERVTGPGASRSDGKGRPGRRVSALDRPRGARRGRRGGGRERRDVRREGEPGLDRRRDPRRAHLRAQGPDLRRVGDAAPSAGAGRPRTRWTRQATTGP